MAFPARASMGIFKPSKKNEKLFSQVSDAYNGLEQRLGFINEVGLGYLTLDRSYKSLSGGEAQRSRLATQLGMGLVGVTYALDEPSVGLHPADHDRLLTVVKGFVIEEIPWLWWSMMQILYLPVIT